MILDRLKQLRDAIEQFKEEAHDLQPSHKRDVSLNIAKYIEQDMRILYHEFGEPPR